MYKPRNFFPREVTRKAALEYVRRYPTLPALTLARRMYEENSCLFWDVEHARASIRLCRKRLPDLPKPIFIPRGSSEKGKVLCGLLARFPDASSCCLARIARRDFPNLFPTVDHARTLLGYHRRKQLGLKKPKTHSDSDQDY